jgi:hypothetical protein
VFFIYSIYVNNFMTANNWKTYLYILLTFLIVLGVFGSINTKAASWESSANLVGYVWDDYDLNGDFDNTEKGIPNLIVNVINPITEDIISTSESDTDGYYILTAPPGIYDIQFINPKGMEQVNTSSIFRKLENNKIKALKLNEQTIPDKTLMINVAFVSSNNPNLLFNKQFNIDFDKKFNEEFNRKFNEKFNEDYNKFFNAGFIAGQNAIPKFDIPELK